MGLSPKSKYLPTYILKTLVIERLFVDIIVGMLEHVPSENIFKHLLHLA